MIVQTRDGRHRSHRTLEERREDLKRRLKVLSPEERAAVRRILDDMSGAMRSGEVGFDDVSEIMEMSQFYAGIAEYHYADELVSLEEFLMDEYYLGAVGQNLWPRWKSDLKELFGGYYTEAVISGSIGSGKTTFCELALLRQFYELIMLEDPQATFGLMPGSEIVLVCFNRDDKLARDVTYGGVRAKLEMSPFFNDAGCKISNSEAFVPGKNVRILAVSAKSAKALGRNVFGGILDETDFLEGSSIGSQDKVTAPGEKPFAELLYDSITRRIKSRYERKGILPGKLLMSSSAKNKTSFTNRRIAESVNSSNVFCRDYALYDVQPPNRFSDKRFWVLVGNERINHRILTDAEYEALGEKGCKDLEDQGCKFLHVPENFRGDFERNLEDAIRDIGGVVTVDISPYIQVRDRIYESVDPTLHHPMRKDTWVTTSPPPIIWSKVCHEVKRRLPGGRPEVVLEPLRHPEAQRHVHIDLSLGKQDAAGLCIAHLVDTVDVERRSEDGHVYAEEAPLIEVDLLLRIEAPPNGEVDIGAVRGLVYHYMDRGYSFGFASMDSFQSAESLQKFRFQGVAAEKVSVDKNTDAYDYLKLALYEGRLSMYNYPWVLRELENLQLDRVKGKVDHPNGGTKDVADALAGVVYTLSTKMSFRAPLLVGISEYEGADGPDDDWVRYTMQRSGDKPPEPVGGTPTGGKPLVFSG